MSQVAIVQADPSGATSLHPFTALTPEVVLGALADVGFLPSGIFLPLNSYENRVYQIGQEDGPAVVAKFYRPARHSDAAIREEHAFLDELAGAELPVVPPVARAGETLFFHEGFRFAVFPRRGGRAPDLERRDTLVWLGRFLGRMHAIGARAPFHDRPELSLATYGYAPRDQLRAAAVVPPELAATWDSVVTAALDATAAALARVAPQRTLRLHGDCHAGNVLWTDAGPHFVDFDDCLTGWAMQDLWMLLSGDADSMRGQLTALREGYEAFFTFDPASIWLIEPLRTLRLLHYSAWIARRWDDPAFPAAFPWFGTPRYWEDRILELREQIALLAEPLLDPY